jgi:hypothetical protein
MGGDEEGGQRRERRRGARLRDVLRHRLIVLSFCAAGRRREGMKGKNT